MTIEFCRENLCGEEMLCNEKQPSVWLQWFRCRSSLTHSPKCGSLQRMRVLAAAREQPLAARKSSHDPLIRISGIKTKSEPFDSFLVNLVRANGAGTRWGRATPHTLVAPVTVTVLSERASRTVTVTARAAELALLLVFNVFMLPARAGRAVSVWGWITESAFGHRV